MKQFLLPLLLSLLLCGCSAQNPQTEEITPPVSAAETQSEETDLHTALSLSPAAADSSQFPLPETVTGFLFLDEDLLLLSGREASTTLTLVDPESGQSISVYEVPFVLTTQNATLQVLDTGISFFAHPSMETVILDRSLREVRRIAAPEGLMGMPLLSADGRTLYYCTDSAVRALALDSGISKILKEVSYPVQGLSGLLEDSVLQLSITESDGTWRTLFLSSETGQLLTARDGNICPETNGSTFFLQLKERNLQTLLFGNTQENPMVLHPRLEPDDCFFLETQVLSTAWQEDSICLDLYDLNTGIRTASLSRLSGLYPETAAMDPGGCIWILCSRDTGEKLLYRWQPEAIQDNTIYSAPYYTQQNPDYDGLAACSLYAEELGEKYGINIRVYKDAAALEPWDYHLEHEYQASVLHRELEALDARLSHFPEGFLQTLAGKFTSLNICLVRSAVGSPESGSLEAVNGIQFMDDFNAYIILATDHNTEYALYHELSHLMETVVLTESVAFDRWDHLNPADFRYDNDYITNRSRDGSPWLKEGKEYFIDTYSMSYPKEDRARLFEYAMTAGHGQLFASPNLQAKLKQLCLGIQEGFGLEKSPDSFLWEQYLTEPLNIAN